MTKLKCIIVDDEPLALDILENYIARLDNLELSARCANAIEAFNVLQQQHIDLIFLDIQMPKLNGIEFLKSVKHLPKVVFTTAYRDYALESYELNVADYLLKPISFDRFLKSIQKIYEMLPVGEKPDKSREIVVKNPDPAHIAENNEAFIYLKADKKMVKIMLKDIIFIESLKDYVKVKTLHKEVISYQRISYLEEKLPEELFLRIHRSFIVAKDKIESFSATSIEAGGIEIPIGRNYKNETLKLLAKDNLLEE